MSGKIHIIGICGTFMGGVARLARDLGLHVTGSDANTYPPMSTQLESLGIELFEGYAAENIPTDVDTVLVGNAISRGNPELEAVLEGGVRYTSGAQWLGDHVLNGRWVLAVAGTHGKTTTSSILAWILEHNGMSPGYLIGGVPENFGESARLGETPFFVIEADEYDTAFCDKRSKFVHYRPRTVILNNLEFDHADIFSDLAAIQTQFHHLVRTVPATGQLIVNQQSDALAEVLSRGYWSETTWFGGDGSDWRVSKSKPDASEFEIIHHQQHYPVRWSLIGDHNMANAVAAVAAAHHVGVTVAHAAESLSAFKSVKRRMEKIYDANNVCVYDDFAHHPTAIREALGGLRARVGNETVIAVLEPRSNTMKQGVHKHLLHESLAAADATLIFADSNLQWDVQALQSDTLKTFHDTEALLAAIIDAIGSDGPHHVLIMSNGGFENLYQRLTDLLSQR